MSKANMSSAGLPAAFGAVAVELEEIRHGMIAIVENCRRLGIDTREYLEEVLTRLPGMKGSEAITLTPANWLRAQQGKQARKAA